MVVESIFNPIHLKIDIERKIKTLTKDRELDFKELGRVRVGSELWRNHSSSINYTTYRINSLRSRYRRLNKIHR